MRENPSMTVRDALLQGANTEKNRARVEAVISGNKSLYGDGNVTTADAYARMGKVMRRGEVFAADARQAQDMPPVVQPPAPPVMSTVDPLTVPVIASGSVPPSPSAPSVPPTPEASPPVLAPMSFGNSSKSIQVSLPSAETNQDVCDRRIAHIVTGGIA
jgi:hypothetical protein